MNQAVIVQFLAANPILSAEAPRKAVLAGYKLDFSAPDGERKSFGLPTLVEQTGANVEGVVYLLSPDQLEYLDTEQPGYRRFQANAVVDDKKASVTTYRSERTVAGLHADAAYVKCMIDGAKELGLSEQYIASLASLTSETQVASPTPTSALAGSALSVVQ